MRIGKTNPMVKEIFKAILKVRIQLINIVMRKLIYYKNNS